MSLMTDQIHQYHHNQLKRYYDIHAKIYDATRWSFLFGRQTLIEKLKGYAHPKQILEVGCGTGYNLMRLHPIYPETKICGMDLSEAMISTAKKNLMKKSMDVQLIRSAFGEENILPFTPDLILFSYALSMFNPGWEAALSAAYNALSKNGILAVVDFHNSPFSTFKNWMGMNHVKMEGHLLKSLKEYFKSPYTEVFNAYAGIWEYFQFIGKKI